MMIKTPRQHEERERLKQNRRDKMLENCPIVNSSSNAPVANTSPLTKSKDSVLSDRIDSVFGAYDGVKDQIIKSNLLGISNSGMQQSSTTYNVKQKVHRPQLKIPPIGNILSTIIGVVKTPLTSIKTPKESTFPFDKSRELFDDLKLSDDESDDCAAKRAGQQVGGKIITGTNVSSSNHSLKSTCSEANLISEKTVSLSPKTVFPQTKLSDEPIAKIPCKLPYKPSRIARKRSRHSSTTSCESDDSSDTSSCESTDRENNCDNTVSCVVPAKHSWSLADQLSKMRETADSLGKKDDLFGEDEDGDFDVDDDDSSDDDYTPIKKLTKKNCISKSYQRHKNDLKQQVQISKGKQFPNKPMAKISSSNPINDSCTNISGNRPLSNISGTRKPLTNSTDRTLLNKSVSQTALNNSKNRASTSDTSNQASSNSSSNRVSNTASNHALVKNNGNRISSNNSGNRTSVSNSSNRASVNMSGNQPLNICGDQLSANESGSQTLKSSGSQTLSSSKKSKSNFCSKSNADSSSNKQSEGSHVNIAPEKSHSKTVCDDIYRSHSSSISLKLQTASQSHDTFKPTSQSVQKDANREDRKDLSKAKPLLKTPLSFVDQRLPSSIKLKASDLLRFDSDGHPSLRVSISMSNLKRRPKRKRNYSISQDPSKRPKLVQPKVTIDRIDFEKNEQIKIGKEPKKMAKVEPFVESRRRSSALTLDESSGHVASSLSSRMSRDQCLVKAKTIKHSADSMPSNEPFNKSMVYLEAVLWFIRCAQSMEDGLQPDEKAAYAMYSGTLDLVKFLAAFRSLNEGDPSGQELKLMILCLKCQAFLYQRLVRIKSDCLFNIGKCLQEHFKQLSRSIQAPSPGGGLTLSPPSPQVLSDLKCGPQIPVSHKMITMMEDFTQHSMNAMIRDRKWDEASDMGRKAEDFLTVLNQRCQGTLALSSTVDDLVLYMETGMKMLHYTMTT